MDKQPQAYKIDEKDTIREFKLLDNGDVELHEVEERTGFFNGRQIMTMLRKYESSKDEIDRLLSDDYREGLEKQREKLVAQITKLKPVAEKAMERFEERQKQEHADRAVKKAHELLSESSEDGNRMLLAVWEQVPKERHEEFSEEERAKILKLKRKSRKR